MAKNLFNTGYLSRDGGVYGMVNVQTDEFVNAVDVSNSGNNNEKLVGKNVINFTATIFSDADKPPITPQPAPTLMALEYANILYEGQVHLKEINFSGQIDDKIAYGIKGQFVGVAQVTITDVILSNLSAAAVGRSDVTAISHVTLTPDLASAIARTVEPNIINNVLIAGLNASAIADAAIGRIDLTIRISGAFASAIASSLDPTVLNPVILTNIIASAIARADTTALTPVFIGNMIADIIAGVVDPAIINNVDISNMIASALVSADTTALTPVLLSDLLADVIVRTVDPGIGQPVVLSNLVATAIASILDPNVENPVLLSNLIAEALASVLDPAAIEEPIVISNQIASTIIRTVDPPEDRDLIRTTGDNRHFSIGTGDWGGIALRWDSLNFRAEHNGTPNFDFYLEFIGTAEGLYQGMRFQLDFDHWNGANVNWTIEIWSENLAQSQTLAGGWLTGTGSKQYIGEIPHSWAHQLFLRINHRLGFPTPVGQIDNVICKEILL